MNFGQGQIKNPSFAGSLDMEWPINVAPFWCQPVIFRKMVFSILVYFRMSQPNFISIGTEEGGQYTLAKISTHIDDWVTLTNEFDFKPPCKIVCAMAKVPSFEDTIYNVWIEILSWQMIHTRISLYSSLAAVDLDGFKITQ